MAMTCDCCVRARRSAANCLTCSWMKSISRMLRRGRRVPMGSVFPCSADVLVNFPAAILVQPQDSTVFPLKSATFNVLAFSSTPVRYQWRFNGGNISGATNASFTIGSVQPRDDGLYTVGVVDSVGTN